MTLDEEEVADALALEYVHPKNTVRAKEAIARATYRILAGVPAFAPSKVREVGERLEARGNALNQRIADKITASINKAREEES